ncbi:MAG: TPM domain-containing protein [Myxococcota bacterium]
MRLLALLALLAPVVSMAAAQSPPPGEVGSWTPAIEAPIVDLAARLTHAEEERLSALLREHHDITGAQLAVLIIDSTGGEPIEDFSLRVAEAWGGGDAGSDDGMLVTFAAGDRRMRIEVGYGLESAVPDAVARRTLDGAKGRLRAGDWDGAVEHVVMDLVRRTTPAGQLPAAVRDFVPQPVYTPPPPRQKTTPGDVLWVVFPFLLVVFFAALAGSGGGSSYTSSGGSSYTSSSSFSTSSSSSFSSSSSSYSGGGGSFGGGGASSSW